MYTCHLFLISSASIRSLLFLPFIVPILAWDPLLISQFSWRNFWSFPFDCLPLLLCTVQVRIPSYLSLLLSGTLHSSVTLSLAFHFFSQLFVKFCYFCLLLVSYSLQPHRLQHARLLCPLLSIFQSFLKLMYIESVMPFNHLILCCPCLLLPSIFPSIRVFSNESSFRIM